MRVVWVVFFPFCTSVLLSTEYTYDSFIERVKKHHPISYQADLIGESGDAYVRKARGAFDPKLSGNIQQKYYNEKQYYSYVQSGLKIPTWYGVSFDGGYSMNDGVFLNPESVLPSDGLIHAGVSVTFGKGLFIDKRRAELQQAKIYLKSTKLQQKVMLNQLILDASRAYYKWKQKFLEKNIYKEAIKNAEQRLQGVRESVEFGDKPAIDSIEAKIFLQNRKIKYLDKKLEFDNAGLLLSVYLWQDGRIPLELDSTLEPTQELIIPTEDLLLPSSIVDQHPEIVIYQNKSQIQEIDLRLKKEGLKPTLDLKYNMLNAPLNGNYFPVGNFNNYKWGGTFSYPLFLRKERANIELSRIKFQEINSDIALKKKQVAYKVNAALNKTLLGIDQFNLARINAQDYERLLNSEKKLFSFGESSVFLMNYREKSWIDARVKMVDSYTRAIVSRKEFDYHFFNF